MPIIDQNMLTDIAKATRRRYEQRFDVHGVTPLSLGWGNYEQQLVRFGQAMSLLALEDTHVVDIGCGFGGFYQYLKDRSVGVRYTGIDLCQDFIEAGRQLHPEGEFLRADLAVDDLPEGDVVVMLGLLNFRQPSVDNLDYAQFMISKAFARTRHALVCDFISLQYAPEYSPDDWIYYYDPQKIMTIATKLTPRWVLNQDYPCIPQREMMLKLTKVST